MKFEYKTVSEVAALTADQAQYYSEQKRAFENNATKELIAEEIKKKFPDETPEQIKAREDEAQKNKDEFKEMKETIAQLKEAQTGGASAAKITIPKAVATQKDDLKKVLKGQMDEVELKADTARASITTNPNQMLLPGIGQLIRIARSYYNLVRKVNVPMGNHNGTIKYLDWDEDTTVKAAAAVAEGGTFPESTATFKGYSIEIKKLGDTLPVNEEFFEDEVSAGAELEGFIQNNVESKIDTDLINADGTGNNIKGLVASVDAYTPVASGIVGANLYDLIVKVKNAITKPAGNKYRPDFAIMSLTTIEKLVLAKDANENYMFPPQHPIYNFIVEDNSVPDNQMVVGDSRYPVIFEMGGVTISRGMVGTQFVKDQLTLKARKRMLHLIKNSDKSGFRKVLDVEAAIATIAGGVAP